MYEWKNINQPDRGRSLYLTYSWVTLEKFSIVKLQKLTRNSQVMLHSDLLSKKILAVLHSTKFGSLGEPKKSPLKMISRCLVLPDPGATWIGMNSTFQSFFHFTEH